MFGGWSMFFHVFFSMEGLGGGMVAGVKIGQLQINQ